MVDLNDLMQQAKRMQEQFAEAQEKLANEVITGESGAGLVRITVNGKLEVKKVWLDPSLLEEEKEVVEELIAAAFNAAGEQVDERSKGQLSSMAGGIDLPGGFKLPL